MEFRHLTQRKRNWTVSPKPLPAPKAIVLFIGLTQEIHAYDSRKTWLFPKFISISTSKSGPCPYKFCEFQIQEQSLFKFSSADLSNKANEKEKEFKGKEQGKS